MYCKSFLQCAPSSYPKREAEEILKKSSIHTYLSFIFYFLVSFWETARTRRREERYWSSKSRATYAKHGTEQLFKETAMQDARKKTPGNKRPSKHNNGKSSLDVSSRHRIATVFEKTFSKHGFWKCLMWNFRCEEGQAARGLALDIIAAGMKMR